MSREIKFRIWDIFNKTYLKSCTGGLNFIFNKQWEPISKFIGSESFIVEQFTGLLDKNGKEIYDGDILEYQDWDKNGNTNNLERHPKAYYKSEVKYFPAHFSALDTSGDNHGFILHEDTIKEHNAKVIGNIYQNPDLLK
jgi:uncharacterized phage protein (TIGR01671 family)